ncbi:hypothetical protein CQ019_00870 [Arthrobacter sp. MYb229]|nr:hypothetical protein CQ019_00870 [Arthrobacter sp. MYb229]PRB52906.1 hypothetical protein CQ013_00870 [Arthrobacter sp. MYb216]
MAVGGFVFSRGEFSGRALGEVPPPEALLDRRAALPEPAAGPDKGGSAMEYQQFKEPAILRVHQRLCRWEAPALRAIVTSAIRQQGLRWVTI